MAWLGEEWPGSEQLSIRIFDRSIIADGIVLALVQGRSLRLTYSIRCDPEWRVRSVDVEIHDHGQVHLVSDGEGRWWTSSGEPMDSLSGCMDVDIRATPFTNTLPIRRLGLMPGESRDVSMAFIDVPALDVRAVDQRYTCVEASAHGGVYRFESGDFSADLSVDSDGLVIDYPGGWRRADLLDDHDGRRI
ncbi:MAG: putative glycolipid-binding domain-containing protein [Chloroflexota bacterium]